MSDSDYMEQWFPKSETPQPESVVERLEKECHGCLTAEDAIAEIRRLKEENENLEEAADQFEHQLNAGCKIIARYRTALERIRGHCNPKHQATLHIRNIATEALEGER